MVAWFLGLYCDCFDPKSSDRAEILLDTYYYTSDTARYAYNYRSSFTSVGSYSENRWSRYSPSDRVYLVYYHQYRYTWVILDQEVPMGWVVWGYAVHVVEYIMQAYQAVAAFPTERAILLSHARIVISQCWLINNRAGGRLSCYRRKRLWG